MSTIKPSCQFSLTVQLTLNESELGALDALAGYGVEPFLKCFYEHMGKSYLEPYEHGLRSLFANVRENSGTIIRAAQMARNTFAENKPK